METHGNAKRAAYKLAVLFNTEEQVLAYLHNYLTQHPAAEFPVHDACHFYLPDGGLWDIDAWRDLVIQYGHQVIRYLHFAPEIAIKLNGDDIPLEKLRRNIQTEYMNPATNDKWLKKESDSMQKYSNYVDKQVKQIEGAKQYREKPMTAEERNNLKARLLEQHKIEKQQFIQSTARQEIERKINKKLHDVVLEQMIKKDISITQSEHKHSRVVREIKQRDINQKSPKQIQELAMEIGYGEEGKELPDFALMCTYYGYPLEQFKQMMEIYKKGKNVADVLPDLFIDGDTVGEPGYYFVKLSKKDPRGLILGELTNCCQSVGNHAEECAIHGASSPDAGFYAIMKKAENGKIDIMHDKIIAQSYAWLRKMAI